MPRGCWQSEVPSDEGDAVIGEAKGAFHGGVGDQLVLEQVKVEVQSLPVGSRRSSRSRRCRRSCRSGWGGCLHRPGKRAHCLPPGRNTERTRSSALPWHQRRCSAWGRKLDEWPFPQPCLPRGMPRSQSGRWLDKRKQIPKQTGTRTHSPRRRREPRNRSHKWMWWRRSGTEDVDDRNHHRPG